MSKTVVHLYNIGYQGLSIDRFLEIIRHNGVELIIDIRFNPYSRNKDFSRKTLKKHLQKSGIEYQHLKELGSPEDIRTQLKQTNDYELFFKQYREYLNTQSDTLTELYNILQSNKVCLLCMERDINICHRKTVIEQLMGMSSPGIMIESVDL